MLDQLHVPSHVVVLLQPFLLNFIEPDRHQGSGAEKSVPYLSLSFGCCDTWVT